jgi:hypothetical protein
MKILNTYRICDLRINRCLTRFGTEEWFLVDEGAPLDELGLHPTIAQGTREEVAARVNEELEKAA